MGRIAFYNFEQNNEFILAETSAELIRGISHTASGEDIFISIGDVSCMKLNAYDLTVTDTLVLVEDQGPAHRPVSERAFTMLCEDKSVVFTFDLPDMKEAPHAPKIPSMTIFEMRQNALETHDPDNIRFTTENCIPFDFSGEHVLYMRTSNGGTERELHLYRVA